LEPNTLNGYKHCNTAEHSFWQEFELRAMKFEIYEYSNITQTRQKSNKKVSTAFGRGIQAELMFMALLNAASVEVQRLLEKWHFGACVASVDEQQPLAKTKAPFRLEVINFPNPQNK